LNLVRNRRNTIWQKDAAKVFSALCSPSTFLWLVSESSLLENLEDFSTNLKMIFIGAIGEDTDASSKKTLTFFLNPRSWDMTV